MPENREKKNLRPCAKCQKRFFSTLSKNFFEFKLTFNLMISMEECEVLCDILGIMLNGQLKCIGNIPSLKRKYGEGYSLIIKTKYINNSENDTTFKEVNKFIQENVPNSTLEGLIYINFNFF